MNQTPTTAEQPFADMAASFEGLIANIGTAVAIAMVLGFALLIFKTFSAVSTTSRTR